MDLRVYNKFQGVKTFEVIQNGGDCLYIPYSMMHFVNKTQPGFSIGFSYMWLPTSHYDPDACQQAPTVPIPLAAFDTLWYFSGKGVVPQGYPDPYDEVVKLLQFQMLYSAATKLYQLLLTKKRTQRNGKMLRVLESFGIGRGGGSADDPEEAADDLKCVFHKFKMLPKLRLTPAIMTGFLQSGSSMLRNTPSAGRDMFDRLSAFGSNPEKG